MVKLTSYGGYRGVKTRLIKQVQPPCVSCQHLLDCARFRLACADYVQHVRTGARPRRDRRPNRASFELAIGDIDE